MNLSTLCYPYADLGDHFYQRIAPEPVQQPDLIVFNQTLAGQLGLSDTPLLDAPPQQVFSGNTLPEGIEPLAMVYAGHQFGHFNPGLGDGRAVLLAQLRDGEGRLFDIQLKGSGRTRFSRNGDGRSALGPVLREYLLSEAMHALGVPTTRALAAVTTGEQVARERLVPGGIITRIARSFVRVGTFQYFAYHDDAASVGKLVDYMLRHHFSVPEAGQNPALHLLREVIDRQASLIARWMQLGFIHGVMNTDNMSIVGETIDYGPCAFMDGFRFDQVYSSIDHHGRYAYSNQPNIGMWNLSRFAETLLPQLADDEEEAVELAKSALDGYISAFQQYWIDGMRAKLGLAIRHAEDKTLVDDWLKLMDRQHADFTLAFYQLSQLSQQADDRDADLLALFDDDREVTAWLQRWRQRLQQENTDDEQRQGAMQQVNPVYIPRNHQIEAVIRAAEDNNDFAPFHALLDVLQQPYQIQADKEAYMAPPRAHEIVQQTFCGT